MDINWVIAFSSGVLCFFAPCVLPLIPSYLIFVSGISFDHFDELKTMHNRRIMLIHVTAFVLGFSSVFVALGLSSSIIGRFLLSYQIYLCIINYHSFFKKIHPNPVFRLHLYQKLLLLTLNPCQPFSSLHSYSVTIRLYPCNPCPPLPNPSFLIRVYPSPSV